ncbi:MAG TPA: RsmG family class I SAM-dependent methyltransferase [Gaiellaceae bacterium]|nr:RsmG family class I SAM-dependent methyltransferase [Gaiellaceae bacterium]
MSSSRGNPPVSPDPFPLSAAAAELLQRWIAVVVSTPGLTSIRDPGEARRMLLEDSLRGAGVVGELEGPIVDVGSGGGAPGIPLAAALPERDVTLLEAERRKADLLRRWMHELPNLRVVWGRAEEQEVDRFGVAVAKALAPPPVAVEWVLPLVRPGGAAVLWVGPTADLGAVFRVSELLAGGRPQERDGLLVVPKVGATPAGFPRRPGMARKRPLA